MILPAPLPWRASTDRDTVAHKMAAATARMIVERQYAEGFLLTEAELTAQHGASRTPAREAMLQLESWGLIRLAPKKGGVVTTVTMEERRDLLALRAIFETEAVAALTDADELAALGAHLEDALARQREALDAQDLLSFADADYSFHAIIISSGGNRVIGELLEQLAPRLARLVYLASADAPSRVSVLLDEHERLAACALAGDAVTFARLVREHIAGGHFPGESLGGGAFPDGRSAR